MPEIEFLIFEMKFLRSMLPIMSLEDACFFSDAYIKGIDRLTEEEVKKLNELYNKFDKGTYAEIPKTE